MAIFMALLGHIAGGGALPHIAGIAAPWALALMVSVLLSGTRLSLVRLTLSVLVSQALFHMLFTIGTPSGAVVDPLALHCSPFGGSILPNLPPVAGVDGSMWLGHAIAVIFTVSLLYRGELLLRALLRTAEQFVQYLRRTLDIPTHLHAPAFPRVAGLFHAAHFPRTLILRTLRGRAPPLAFM